MKQIINSSANNKLLLVNKLDEKKKSTFKNRVVISIFVVIFYLLVLVFSVLADSTSANWINMELNIKSVFAFLLIFLLYIPFVFANYEAISLIFDKHKKLYFLILISCYSIVYFVVNLFLVIANYFVPLLITDKIPVVFGLIFLVTTIVVLAITNIFLKVFNSVSIKNVISLNAIVLVIMLGFLSIVYCAIFKGWFALLFLLFSVMVTDAFCYLFGLFFGKHKMSKIISPNKTWEGAILGSTFSIAILLILCGFVSIDQNRSAIVLSYVIGYQTNLVAIIWIVLVFLSILMVVFSILGDLFFSYIKRLFNIKDFSNFLRSHGGFLDRLDAMLIVSIVFAIYSLFASNINLLNSF
ncbi:MAG: phosphatidate cytidylyltransferase [Malacoplasma sp.]|nr:phosphatidate cytidylyltransferase [Malacoplasma sp.]